jgi:methionyl-tRNA synthetase
VDDANDRMVGDVNFFIYEDDDAQEDGPQDAKSNAALRGEVDVMIAHQDHRRQGYGSAAVQTLLLYLRQNIKDILAEYTRGAGIARDADMAGLMVKIKQGNAGSRRLFEKLGFRQKGGVNYFGEVTLLISWEEVETLVAGWLDSEESYREMAYEAK